jgi:hypothetical protein
MHACMHFRSSYTKHTSAHTEMDNSVSEVGLGVGLNGICRVHYKIERGFTVFSGIQLLKGRNFWGSTTDRFDFQWDFQQMC